MDNHKINRISKYRQLFSNMGWRYVFFRTGYEIKRRSGWLKKKFPVNGKQEIDLSLEEWKINSEPFFFTSREALSFDKKPVRQLKEAAGNILKGNILFFNHQYFNLGTSYDWITNPETGHRYDITKHWTEIEDLNAGDGDIKYVWEKSRFSYLYTIMRYDYHFDRDHAEFVFKEIEDWIHTNPPNMGPNYKCSQEISLRILNWIFALYFYRNSAGLTGERFRKILNSIYRQLHHVYRNIHFSRIAVRNNHAITETLTLYIVSSLFPQFPASREWKKRGKKWFEQEIEYQVYEDGTFLQFSMNYQRLVIQLLTWAIRIARLHGDTYNAGVHDKAYKALDFLYQCQEESNGHLPNYGSNDGALFFKLSDNDYRDYRPQLDALHRLLTGKRLYGEETEDAGWYNYDGNGQGYKALKKKYGISRFDAGGYYLIREPDSFTFIRCGKHKDRPAHADNLHIDVWYKGENVLVDGGTYKYNTNDRLLGYFMGSASHNTVMLDHYDQMLKGPRFIWFYWSQAIGAEIEETDSCYEFKGAVNGFRHLAGNIVHERTVRKYKNRPLWEITDRIEHKPRGMKINQYWHTLSGDALFESQAGGIRNESYYSSCYGKKERARQYIFSTDKNIIETKIKLIK